MIKLLFLLKGKAAPTSCSRQPSAQWFLPILLIIQTGKEPGTEMDAFVFLCKQSVNDIVLSDHPSIYPMACIMMERRHSNIFVEP